MGLKQYRAIDISILMIIMCVVECASLLVLSTTSSSYFLSVIPLVTLIVYMRWGAYGLIFGAVGGIIEAVLLLNVNSAVYGDMDTASVIKWSVVYSAGYFSTAFCIFYFRIGKKKLADNIFLVLLYTVTAFLLMCTGRSAAIAVFYGKNFFDAFVENISREVLNFVFTFLVLLIARKQDSVFADQKEYFETHKVRR